MGLINEVILVCLFWGLINEVDLYSFTSAEEFGSLCVDSLRKSFSPFLVYITTIHGTLYCE